MEEKRKIYTKVWFSWVLELVSLFILTPVVLFIMWKYKHYNKKVRIVLSIILSILFLFICASLSIDTSTTETTSPTKTKSEEKTNEEYSSFKVEKVDASMDLEIVNGQAVVTISSNLMDGIIFEVSILNDELQIVSSFEPLKDGKIVKTFDIPKEWKPSYIVGTSMVRFNLEEHPQSQSITDVYGLKGEKLKGQSVEKTDAGYKYVTLESNTVAYPSEEEVEKAEILKYKNSCKSFTYGDLARNADGLIGENIVCTGQVIQTLEDGDEVQMRVNVTAGDYGFWDDTVFVLYNKSDFSTRILEEDIIQFWGSINGLITYETVMGNDVTIPSVNVKYIEILEGI